MTGERSSGPDGQASRSAGSARSRATIAPAYSASAPHKHHPDTDDLIARGERPDGGQFRGEAGDSQRAGDESVEQFR
ncbi:hypothetical protein GJ629_10900 [Halapricum sp. CBA1109]|uniref:hypothetical protein n=1 Tax=Halapricum sp. CBA1109 TaxID=2668068 RepID=UPI0012F9472B|nr:hypothetical protein [Halapricum sp. CBA1109]MUV90344.1 hypothetical protein [Halapricum sp. CBA1109]